MVKLEDSKATPEKVVYRYMGKRLKKQLKQLIVSCLLHMTYFPNSPNI